jgi:uncharacterized protein (DUF3084 family)
VDKRRAKQAKADLGRLRAERDKLRAEVRELRIVVGLAHGECKRFRADRDAARSDLDKLTKAIQSIRSESNG